MAGPQTEAKSRIPVTLVTGFLGSGKTTFINTALRSPELARTVVVVNDSGGGVFSLLEPGADGERDAASAARFERMFGTPHAMDLAAVCSGLGVPHARVASAAVLIDQLPA